MTSSFVLQQYFLGPQFSWWFGTLNTFDYFLYHNTVPLALSLYFYFFSVSYSDLFSSLCRRSKDVIVLSNFSLISLHLLQRFYPFISPTVIVKKTEKTVTNLPWNLSAEFSLECLNAYKIRTGSRLNFSVLSTAIPPWTRPISSEFLCVFTFSEFLILVNFFLWNLCQIFPFSLPLV